MTHIDAGMDAEKKAEMVQRSGGARTFPQIFVGDTHVGGFDDLSALEVDLVAARLTPADKADLRQAMAALDGPILTLVSDRISPALYAKERTICSDTTAAGGNASLMAEADGPSGA